MVRAIVTVLCTLPLLAGCDPQVTDGSVNALSAVCSEAGTDCILTINASLTDEEGQPVQESLSADQFEIDDLSLEYLNDETLNLRVQKSPLSEISYTPIDEMADFIAANVLLDQSRSMSDNDPDDLRFDAAHDLTSILLNDDRGRPHQMAMMSFPHVMGLGDDFDCTDVWQDFTTDSSKIYLSLGAMQTASLGDTPLYCSITEVLPVLAAAFDPSEAERVLILMTDGEDTGYYDVSFDTTLETALDLEIPIYIVGLGESVDHGALQQLALETGGLYIPTSVPERLTEAFEGLSRSLSGSVNLISDLILSSSSDDLQEGIYHIRGTIRYRKGSRKELSLTLDTEMALIFEE